MIQVSVDPEKIGHRIADVGPGGAESNVVTVGPFPVEPERLKAEQILDLLQKGETFAELAHQYSESPDREQGGDLGFVRRGDRPDFWGFQKNQYCDFWTWISWWNFN